MTSRVRFGLAVVHTKARPAHSGGLVETILGLIVKGDFMDEPKVEPVPELVVAPVVEPPKSNIGTYAGMAALVVGMAALFVLTNPKKPEPVKQEVVATPEQVDAAVKADAEALKAENQVLVFDKNAICAKACVDLKAGYASGVWIKSCRCLYPD